MVVLTGQRVWQKVEHIYAAKTACRSALVPAVHTGLHFTFCFLHWTALEIAPHCILHFTLHCTVCSALHWRSHCTANICSDQCTVMHSCSEVKRKVPCTVFFSIWQYNVGKSIFQFTSEQRPDVSNLCQLWNSHIRCSLVETLFSVAHFLWSA